MDEVLCGVHAVYEALASDRAVERIYVAREHATPRVRELIRLAAEKGVPVRKEDRRTLDRLSAGQAHQGVIASCASVGYARLTDISKSPSALAVILDGVEDPHNLGAVIRTAESAGASGVIVPDRHSAPLSAAVARASAGAVAHLPVVRVGNIVRTIDELKRNGWWVVGVDPAGDRLWTEFRYDGPIVIVLGGEQRGVRRLVREHCDAVVRLPMRGKVESLNVSVAAGIVLYEVVRQRSAKEANPRVYTDKDRI